MNDRKVFYKWLYLFLLLLTVMPLSGCLFRTREIERRVSTARLETANREQLIDFIDNNAARLQSLKANVDFNLTVSKQKKGGKPNEYKVTEYTEVSGYLLVRKPEMLRMIGLVPAVRNTLFDMVSNGRTFSLSIPPQSKFIVGSNQVGRPSLQPLENIRPQAIFDALLLKQIDPENEIAVLELGTEIVKDPKSHKDMDQDDYEIIVIRREGKDWYLSRKIVFSRVDLKPDREMIYNLQGQLVTDASYENFKDYGGVQFPERVHIERPIEGYNIQLTITKLSLNQQLTDAQFELPQPPGSKVINLDQKTGNTATLDGQPAEETPKPAH